MTDRIDFQSEFDATRANAEKLARLYETSDAAKRRAMLVAIMTTPSPYGTGCYSMVLTAWTAQLMRRETVEEFLEQILAIGVEIAEQRQAEILSLHRMSTTVLNIPKNELN